MARGWRAAWGLLGLGLFGLGLLGPGLFGVGLLGLGATLDGFGFAFVVAGCAGTELSPAVAGSSTSPAKSSLALGAGSAEVSAREPGLLGPDAPRAGAARSQ